MKKLLFLCVFLGSLNFASAQHGNFSVGYSLNYYHHSLDNPKASLVMLNYSDKEFYDDKVAIVPFTYGYHIEARAKAGFVVNFTLQKNKNTGGGKDPGTGQEETFQLKHFNGRVGIGFKTSGNRTSFGVTFDVGAAGYKYKITGGPGTTTEFQEWNTLNCLSYGMTTSYEYYFTSRLGFRAMWYWHWVAMENVLQVHERKLKYSTVGAGLFLYIRRNYE